MNYIRSSLTALMHRPPPRVRTTASLLFSDGGGGGWDPSRTPSTSPRCWLGSQQQQTRNMSWYISRAARKRMPLTTKKAKKGGFYKGNRATSEGRHTSKGRYIINPLKRLQLVIPDMTGFKLKPYIAAGASRFPPETRGETGAS